MLHHVPPAIYLLCIIYPPFPPLFTPRPRLSYRLAPHIKVSQDVDPLSISFTQNAGGEVLESVYEYCTVLYLYSTLYTVHYT